MVEQGTVSLLPEVVSNEILPLPHPVPSLDNTLNVVDGVVERTAGNTVYSRPLVLRKLFSGAQEYLTQHLEERNWFAKGVEDYFLARRDPAERSSYAITMPASEVERTSENPMLDRGTRLVVAAQEVMQALRQDTFEGDKPEKVNGNKVKLNMAQYANFFGGYRIPQTSIDQYIPAEPTFPSRHMAVSFGGHFYRVDLFNDNGEMVSSANVYRQLAEITSHQITIPTGQENFAYLGAITGLPKDRLGEIYYQLSKKNKQALEDLNTAAFVLNLDESAGVYNKSDLSAYVRDGNGQEINPWNLKTMQIKIAGNGDAAILLDHAGADGSNGLRIAEELVQRAEKVEYSKEPSIASDTQEHPLLVNWQGSFIRQYIGEGKRFLKEVGKRRRIETHHIDSIDGRVVESMGVKADCVVQTAMQIALLKATGVSFSIAEPVNTRRIEGDRLSLELTLTDSANKLMKIGAADLTEPSTASSSKWQTFTSIVRSGNFDAETLSSLGINIQEVSERAHHLKNANAEIVALQQAAKEGHGVLGHLMALNSILFRNFPQGNGLLERALCRIDPVMSNVLLNAVVLSNAGPHRPDQIGDFSTVPGSGESLSIGYFFNKDDSGFTLNIRADKKYAAIVDQLKQEFETAYTYLQSILTADQLLQSS